MANAPQQDLSAVLAKMKSVLQNIVQAKNNPQEVEKAATEGQKEIQTLEQNQSQAGTDNPARPR